MRRSIISAVGISGVETIEVFRTVDEACAGAIAPEIVPLDLSGNATVVTDTVGLNRICVRARDLDGNESTDEAAINVLLDTNPPVVTSLTVTPPTIEITNSVTIEVQATDDVVVSDVLVEVTWPSNPTGVTLPLAGNGPGTFSGSVPFTPFLRELYTVTARAFDGAGNEGTLGTTFTATGDPDLEPPVVLLSIVPDTVAQGGTVQITVSATDNINVDSLMLEINSTPVPIPPSGIVDFVAPAIAIYNVVARAEDPTGNFDEETGSFEAIDPATDTTDPTVAITTPGDGDEALGLVDIIGTADDTTLQSYTLDFAPSGSGSFTNFHTGNTRVVGGLLGTLDTSLLPNGLIDIRLRATDANSNVSQTTTVSVSGENKPGVFQLSVVDLQVPVSGIPISIIRSYDSRTRGTSQDFGHGWKVEVVQSATYQFNRLPGASWSTPIGSLLGGGFCPPGNETAFHIIEIRVSDTEFYQFRPTLDTGVFTTLPVTCPGSMNFTQIGGVPGASLEILHFNQFFYVPGDPDMTYPIDHPTLGGQVFTPRDVRLTTLQGKVLDVNLTDGLQRVADANGNALVINSSGVTHSSGKSVTFVRDGSGRITSITDPLGHTTTYTYDANDNLTSREDHLGNRVETTYDANGRPLTNTDANGFVTAFTYDGSGNLLTRTQAVGVLDYLTTFTYDANGNKLTETDARGFTTTFTYDANGNKLTETNPRGFVTTFTYDNRGNVLTRTEATGVLDILTTFAYDSNGRVISETDPMATRPKRRTTVAARSLGSTMKTPPSRCSATTRRGGGPAPPIAFCGRRSMGTTGRTVWSRCAIRPTARSPAPMMLPGGPSPRRMPSAA